MSRPYRGLPIEGELKPSPYYAMNYSVADEIGQV